ncbi:MAG: J domain-containing protein [Lachnospiraceae bacterium]|nr:J domain-containing protein [Lachnospiraceae bacterium]
MDYYRILGLAETADMEAVKKAYRRLAKECHPDAYPGDKKAEERFKQITEAYAVLSDAEKRKKYDKERVRTGKRQKTASDRRPGRQPFRPEGFGSGFEEFFSFAGIQPKHNHESQAQETETKQKAKRNPIDTSGLFERYMGFK